MEIKAELNRQETEEAVRAKVLELLDLPKGSKASVTSISISEEGIVATIELADKKSSPVQRRPSAGVVRKPVQAEQPKETTEQPVAERVVQETPVETAPAPEPTVETPVEQPNETPPFEPDETPAPEGNQTAEPAPSPDAEEAPVRTGSLFSSLARK